MNFGFISDEEDDDDNNSKDKDKDNDSEDDNEYNEFKESKKLVEKTINPIKNIDEFKYFIDLLNYLNNNKKNEYNCWINSLDEKKRKDVNNLMETKRINIQLNKDNNVFIPRRILAIKRNINTNNK